MGGSGRGGYAVRGNVLVAAATGVAASVIGAAFLLGGIGALLSLAGQGLTLDNAVYWPLSAVSVVLGVRVLAPALVALCPPWRGVPLVAIDAAGVELPPTPGGTDVRVTWAEIAGIGIVDDRDVRWQATGTDLPAVGAAAEFVRRYPGPAGSSPGVTDPARWNRPLAGRTLVVVSLVARSPAQAAVFAGVRDELERLVRAARASGRHHVADDLAALTERLAQWQEEWSGVAQRCGVVAAVPTRRLDRERLATAVRSCSPGHGPIRSTLPGSDALHTPHGVAERVLRHASLVASGD